jgi:hypothetical protein
MRIGALLVIRWQGKYTKRHGELGGPIVCLPFLKLESGCMDSFTVTLPRILYSRMKI